MIARVPLRASIFCFAACIISSIVLVLIGALSWALLTAVLAIGFSTLTMLRYSHMMRNERQTDIQDIHARFNSLNSALERLESVEIETRERQRKATRSATKDATASMTAHIDGAVTRLLQEIIDQPERTATLTAIDLARTRQSLLRELRENETSLTQANDDPVTK